MGITPAKQRRYMERQKRLGLKRITVWTDARDAERIRNFARELVAARVGTLETPGLRPWRKP